MPKGKWALGITPRNFHWIMRDKVAICERPGGYGESHRKVRRQEEIIWIREQGFAYVVSLIGGPANLHNYDEHGLEWIHRPWPASEELAPYLEQVYRELHGHVVGERKVVFHMEEVNEKVLGLMAGYLVWAGLVPESFRAVSIVEQIVGRQIEPRGRDIVFEAAALGERRAGGA